MRISNEVGKGRASGSGTIIGMDATTSLVLTCKHLFDDGVGTIVVTLPTGERFYGRYVAVDRYREDLAAVSIIRHDSQQMVHLADKAPVQRTKVTQAGYPRATSQVVTRAGSVWGYSPEDKHLIADFGVIDGDSGSGLLAGDELVGVVWGSLEGHTYATGLEKTRRFVEEKCERWCKPNTPPIAAGGHSRPGPAVNPPAGPDLKPVLDAVAALTKEVKELKARPGEKGPAGAQGPAGPQGPEGPAGPSGKPADSTELIQLKQRVAELEARLANVSGSAVIRVQPK